MSWNKLNEDTKNSMNIDLFKHGARRELWASILSLVMFLGLYLFKFIFSSFLKSILVRFCSDNCKLTLKVPILGVLVNLLYRTQDAFGRNLAFLAAWF